MRFDAVVPDARAPVARAERIGVVFNRDGFASNAPIVTAVRLGRIAFTVENRTGNAHETELSLALPYGTTWTLRQDGRSVELVPTGRKRSTAGFTRPACWRKR
jgi:hypothetical protein